MLFIGAAPLGFAATPDQVDGKCACTGNMGKGMMQDYYPTEIGNFCDAWDGKMDYCMGMDAEDWCPKKWCYVSEECADAAMGSYLAEQGEPQLYYSYGACGDTDTYTGTESDPCACIGNQDKAEQQDYYPLDMGDMCATWDAKMDYCKVDEPADYCDDAWCYTSDKCPGAAKGTYFENEEGPQLYYNYAVCGADDEYTGTEYDPLVDKAPLEVTEWVPYFSYTGDLTDVSGHVKIYADLSPVSSGMKIEFDLTGLDPACAGGADTTVSANSCGLHIHVGSSCTEDAGGHYYSDDLADDPWGAGVYSSPMSGAFELATGLDEEEILGKAFIVHDFNGGRIACGLIHDP